MADMAILSNEIVTRSVTHSMTITDGQVWCVPTSLMTIR